MLRRPCFAIILALIISVPFCGNVFAVGGGGFRNEVVDAEASGKGYAFVAQADSPAAIYYNPAGLMQLKGSQVTVGNTFEQVRNECDSEVAGDVVKTNKHTYQIPHLYVTTPVPGSDEFRIGVGAYSHYGLSIDWHDDSFSKHVTEESDLKIFNINPTLAYKANDWLSVGVGLDYMESELSRFKILTPAASTTNGQIHIKGKDESFGYNIGVLIRPSERDRIGLSYRSQVELNYVGTISLDHLTPAYQAIFGGATYSTAMKSKLILPRSLAVGYARQINDRWLVEFDVEWTDWSSVEEDFLTFPDETDATRLSVLNNGNPSSKDWNDCIAYGFGAEYKATKNLTLRGGYVYMPTVVPSATFDTALPGHDKHGFTVGAGYAFRDFDINASYGIFLYDERKVTNDVGSEVSSNLNGTYDGHVHLLSMGCTYKY